MIFTTQWWPGLLQVKPNLSFGGDESVAMAILTDSDRSGPVWKGLDVQTSALNHAEQQLVTSLTAVYAQGTATNVPAVDVESPWTKFPVQLYPFISQDSNAWLALRKYHAITASVAFDLLLCGTGPPKQQYGQARKALKISSYRKCALLSVDRCVKAVSVPIY